MPQKYKVFFNYNKLFFAKKELSGIEFHKILVNPKKSELKDLIKTLLIADTSLNFLIVSQNLKKTWEEFCEFFEIRKAAGGVVINSKNEKLFIKRRGYWDLPKGHLEKNEKNRQAALREVSEECGIKKLRIIKKLVKTYHTYTLKKSIVLKPTKWYLMAYNGTKAPKPQKEEDITQVVWANAETETEMLKNSFLSIREVIKKANNNF